MSRNLKIIDLLMRLTLGGLFIYAGIRKVIDPAEFANAIAGFKVAPELLINLIALGLPIVEIVLGGMLLIPHNCCIRTSSLGIIFLNLFFILLLTQAWLRGLNVNCGCFGLNIIPPSQWTLPISIGRNIILLAMALTIRQLGRNRNH